MHHCQTRLAACVVTGFGMPELYGGKYAFNRIRRSQVRPVLRRKIIESQQAITVFSQAFDRRRVFGFIGSSRCRTSRPMGKADTVLRARRTLWSTMARRQTGQTTAGKTGCESAQPSLDRKPPLFHTIMQLVEYVPQYSTVETSPRLNQK